MPSQIQVSDVKALDGTAGISIADSTGRVSFTETNPSLTLGSNTIFPSGHVLQVVNATLTNIETPETARTAETVVANATNQITITSGNKVLIYAQVTLKGVASSNCIVVARVREGTDTTGTVLSENQFMDNSTSSVFHTHHTIFAFDDSPADTTPDYTITMLRGSGGTSSVQLYSNTSPYLKIVLMEVKA